MTGADPLRQGTDRGPVAGRGDLVADVARRVIARQARELRANAPGTHAGGDPEALHDLRVATRRLRFALRLFAPWVGREGERSREELRWIAGRLGGVRDLDVFGQGLTNTMAALGTDTATAAALRARVEAWRAPKAQALTRALCSRRWERLVAGVAGLAADRLGMVARGGVATVAEIAPRVIRAASDRVARRGRRATSSGHIAELHGVRIAFKRLRYTTEFFAAAYGSPARTAIREFVQVQDGLGALQDALVARGRLLRLRREFSTRGGAAAELAAIEALLARESAVSDAQRSAFAALWRGVPSLLESLQAALAAAAQPRAPRQQA